MRERPIPFIAEMIRAILAGTKTQTRRIVGLDALRRSDTPGYDWTWRGQAPIKSIAQQRRYAGGCWQDVSAAALLALCPYGVPGDRLWVREAWALYDPGRSEEDNDESLRTITENWSGLSEKQHAFWRRRLHYRADADTYMEQAHGGGAFRWRPSIHMPRWASRLTLEIESVRVERVQDISEADARAEGVSWSGRWTDSFSGVGARDRYGDDIHRNVAAFALAWDSINGRRAPWSANPWVWVIAFRRVEDSHA
jgi:hypothetical protein